MKIEIITNQSKSLLSSIIFLIIGVILITNADIILSFISIVIGSILLISGIINIFIYAQRRKSNNPFANRSLFYSIVLILLGIIFIFFSDIIETSIRFILGGWILMSGIYQLITAISLSHKNTKFISSLIVAIALVILSIYVIFTENLLLSSIGIIMVIYSIIEIMGFIFNKRNCRTITPKPGETTLIIPEKNKKIKK